MYFIKLCPSSNRLSIKSIWFRNTDPNYQGILKQMNAKKPFPPIKRMSAARGNSENYAKQKTPLARVGLNH